MRDKDKIQILKTCFEDVIWMAARYAHGRHTYSPGMVRDAVKNFQKVFPDWTPKQDHVIEPYTGELSGFKIASDYLSDIFNEEAHAKSQEESSV